MVFKSPLYQNLGEYTLELFFPFASNKQIEAKGTTNWVVATQICFIFTQKLGEDDPM